MPHFTVEQDARALHRDELDATRTSELSTMHRLLAAGAAGMTSGTLYLTRARSLVAQAYSRLRMCQNAAAPANLTDARLAAYRLDGSLITQTANFAATMIAKQGGDAYSVALLALLNLIEDEEVYLGAAQVNATAASLSLWRGQGNAFGAAAIAPKLSSIVPGALVAGQPLPANVNVGSTTGTLLWIEGEV